MSSFLYRGISVEMYDRACGRLKPDGQDSKAYLYPSQFLMPAENLFPGNNENNALDKHQNPNRYKEDSFKSKSAYLSTTPFIEIAINYATTRYTQGGYVFTIDRTKLKEHSIDEFDISEYATKIIKPEDEEVLLRPFPYGSSLPAEVIVRIIKVHPQNIIKRYSCTHIKNLIKKSLSDMKCKYKKLK